MIYIIADDLTGATDTGVQLKKKGYNTLVFIAEKLHTINNLDKKNKNVDVFVIDSESRDLAKDEAKVRLKELMRGLRIADSDIIYKKVDSTLRGNIGVEIEEIMKKFNRDICIFAPSYPPNRRVVVGGYLLVQDQPLGMSKYYGGELDKEEASYIPSLLKQDTNFSVGKIDLKEVMRGPENILKRINYLVKDNKKIIVFDAIEDYHLENIFKSCLNFAGSVLYAGSAGLATHFPHITSGSKQEKKINPIPGNEDLSFLVVIGTRRKIMNTQIDYLKEKADVEVLNVDIQKLFNNESKYLDIYFQKARDVLTGKRHLILKNISVSTSEINGLSQRELEITVRDYLGKLSAKIVKDCSINNIIISGGDTSLGFCKAMGINNLEIQAEILPGIPLSKSSINKHKIKIVTKAGGFGETDTLYKIINRLIEYN